MPRLVNPKYESFAQLRVSGKSIGQAYVEAGFKANDSNAARLNGNEQVQGRIAELAEITANRAEIDIERVLRELTRIGLSDIRKVFAPDGSILPPAQWDAGTAAAISSIEVSERQTGNGERGEPIVERTYKVKYWDKNTALDKIAKHFGMFIDRSEVTVTHRLAGLSDDELMTEIRRTLAGHERRTAH